jgi:hypothetical protein
LSTKWLVVQARQISDEVNSNSTVSSYFCEQQQNVVRMLDAFGYDEGAEVVYGCGYSEWKKAHQKKATDEQM